MLRPPFRKEFLLNTGYPAGGAGVSPARGASTMKSGGGATTGITTVGGAGSVMIVATCGATGDAPTITDNMANTWGPPTIDQVGTETRFRIWIKPNFLGGAGHVVTSTGGGGALVTAFVEYTTATGLELQGSIDKLSAPWAIATSGATTVAKSIVFSAGSPTGVAATTTHSCSPATVFLQQTNFATYYGFAVADEVVTTIGVKTETWASSPSGTTYLMAIVVIKGS